jgi:DNA replication protein DnaC
MGVHSPATLTDKELPVCERCGKQMKETFMPWMKNLGTPYLWNCDTPSCKEQDDAIKKELDKAQREKEIKEDREREMSDFLKDPSKVMNVFGVSKKYHLVSFDTFIGGERNITDIRNYVKTIDSSLYIYGKCGSGKTHVAVSIIRELYLLDTWRKMLFISVPELLLRIRDSFHENSKQSELEIVRECTNPDILVLDDMGAEKISEFSVATLYLIINGRLMDERPTIVTSNLSRKQFEEQIDHRIASRFAEYKAIHLDMPDYRKNGIKS